MRMKRIILSATGALALAWGGSASALITATANITETNSDGAGGTISFDLIDPPPGLVTGDFSHTFNFSTDPGVTDTFEDTFTFTLGEDGFGDGSFSANGATLLQQLTFSGIAGDITFDNGVDTPFNITIIGGTIGDLGAPVPIYAGVLNTITIRGTAHGQAFYNGSATFAPGAIPEASTWAMMLIGFGAVGSSIRYRRRKPAAAALNTRKIAYS